MGETEQLTVDVILRLQAKNENLKEKLEKIKQVVNEWNEDASNSFGDMCKIKKILEQE